MALGAAQASLWLGIRGVLPRRGDRQAPLQRMSQGMLSIKGTARQHQTWVGRRQGQGTQRGSDHVIKSLICHHALKCILDTGSTKNDFGVTSNVAGSNL